MSDLIIEPYGGMCNRIFAVISARILADRLGRDLLVDWIPHSDSCCRVSDLFVNLKSLEPDAGPEMAQYHVGDSSPELKWKSYEQLCHDTAGGFLPVGSVRIKSLWEFRPPDIDPDEYAAAFQTQLALLKPVNAILEKIRQLPSRTIGLQIRRGDHWRATKYSPLRLFEDKIAEHVQADAEAVFFLSSDSPEVGSRLRRLHGDRIFYYEGKDYRRTSVTGVQDALVDVITLSRTQLIYGSHKSTFGSLASRFQGIPLRVLATPGASQEWNGVSEDADHDRLFNWDDASKKWRLKKKRLFFWIGWGPRAFALWLRHVWVSSRLYQR